MADERVLIKESTLTAMGNSIRAKTGKTELINPDNMPAEIDGISSGGSSDDINGLIIDDSNTLDRFSWDGNIEGRTIVDISAMTGTEGYYVKVSDNVYTADQIKQYPYLSIYRFLYGYTDNGLVIPTDYGYIIDNLNYGFVGIGSESNYMYLFIHNKDIASAAFSQMLGVPFTIPSNGTYVLYLPNNGENNYKELVIGVPEYSGLTAILGKFATFINVPEGFHGLAGDTYRMNSLKKVVVSKSITHTEPNTFAGCAKLKEVTFLSEGELQLGSGIFQHSASLTTITFKSKTPVSFLSTDICNGCAALTAIKVPAEAVDAYKTKFGNMNNGNAYDVKLADLVVADDSE
jgi:hypothetical protein